MKKKIFKKFGDKNSFFLVVISTNESTGFIYQLYLFRNLFFEINCIYIYLLVISGPCSFLEDDMEIEYPSLMGH